MSDSLIFGMYEKEVSAVLIGGTWYELAPDCEFVWEYGGEIADDTTKYYYFCTRVNGEKVQYSGPFWHIQAVRGYVNRWRDEE